MPSKARNVESSWKSPPYPGVLRPAEDSMDPKKSMLQDHSHVANPQSDAPVLAVRTQETVQPQDVFQPPAGIRNYPPSLDSILAPVGTTESAIKNPDQGSSRPAVHTCNAMAQGKAIRQKDEAAYAATLTEAIITALAKAATSENITDECLQKGLGGASLPHGQTFSGGPKPIDPHPARSSNDKPLCSIDPTTSPAGQEDSRSLQQNRAEEVLKTLQGLGFILQKDPNYSPKPQSPGPEASNKSDHRRSCPTCKKFKGRPCELKCVIFSH